VLAFEDGVVERPMRARIQRLCAIKTASGRVDRLALPGALTPGPSPTAWERGGRN
jgi:hypothetical protein